MPPGRCARAFAAACLLLLLAVALVAVALLLRPAGAGAGAGVAGGAPPRRAPPPESPHLVVDALNLAGGDPARVEAAIDGAAPRLKLRHPGRVMFVVKDGEGALATPARRAALQAAAARNGVYVYAAERYADPPAGSASSRAAAAAGVHSARGRDDFLAAVLAFRWRCPVLTEDRFRDFAEFRATVRPFHVFEFAFWRATPARDFVDPASAAFARLRRPRGVRPAAYGLGPAGAPHRGPGKGQKAAPQIEPPEPPLKRQTLP